MTGLKIFPKTYDIKQPSKMAKTDFSSYLYFSCQVAVPDTYKWLSKIFEKNWDQSQFCIILTGKVGKK